MALGRAQRACLVVSLVVLGLVLAPPLAHAAASWQSGPLVEVGDINCITQQSEYEAGSYLSYYADPANPPQVGQVYYVAIDIAGIGDTCSGAYGSFELSMPSGTAPAISTANPVRCYLKPRSSNTYQNVAGNCPQSLQAGPHGYYLNPTNTNPPFWPVVQGDAVEVQVPVVSSAPLNGTDQFHGFIQLADGESDPNMAPSLLAIVNPSGSQGTSPSTNKQIGVVYASPTITSQTTNVNSTVNANFLGYVENNSNPGTAYAELAKADTAGDCTSPVLFNPSIKSNVASLQNPQTQITGTWSTLYPGGAYCFRIVATVSSGPQAGTYYGNWQYFATQGAFLSNAGTSQYVPPVAHPITGTGCTSGAGCATSNCATGSSCNQTGSVSGAAHVLAVTRAGTGSGSVANGSSLTCPSVCSQTYPTGAQAQTVTLTATPATGSTFGGWSGGGCSGTGTCTVSMSADQNVTATFTLNQKPPPPPPPPPAPRCTLGSLGSRVLLSAHRRSQRPSVGLIRFAARCNQATTGTLSAVLTETLGRKRGKLQTKTFRLGPAHASLAANVSRTLSFRLPSSVLAGLAQHRGEKLLATLAASNAHGSARATASIGKLQSQP